jgi:hypothetical protein
MSEEEGRISQVARKVRLGSGPGRIYIGSAIRKLKAGRREDLILSPCPADGSESSLYEDRGEVGC